MNNIPDDLGTAVNIQSMVFGNFGNDSGTGVGFTRNPSTGEKEIFGEYLPNAQGEDVVGGFRTPMPLSLLEKENKSVYDQLVKAVTLLERHFRDIQDFEFTVERGKLYLLQTRSGKRTGIAALNIALQLVKEKLISEREICKRIDDQHIPQLLADSFDNEALKKAVLLAKGLNASYGAAYGKIVLNPQKAVELAKRGENVILVRPETNPDDVYAMSLSRGILTQKGGLTSHAAVVSRHMGKPAVVGCQAINFIDANTIKIGESILKEGDYISINGSTGEVFLGLIYTIPSEILRVVKGEIPPTKASSVYKNFIKLLAILNKYKSIDVRMNADTVEDATIGIKFGASGIGLCRTEHMFFKKERIPYVQKMIIARNREELTQALDKIFEFQKEDFKALLRVLNGYPITIRTLDPPLHEFLPSVSEIEEQMQRAKTEGNTTKLEELQLLLTKTKLLKELNPMLGHRGCRLGITHPEITQVQAKAIIEAAYEVKKEGVKVNLEIMIPLVNDLNEFLHQKKIILDVYNEIKQREKKPLSLSIGTMIEVPRALMVADQLALHADFFSFGTNDLTQMFFGFSRDDTFEIIQMYKELKIYKDDPFEIIDAQYMGEFIIQGIKRARAVNPKLKIGVCGEHGGNPESIKFFKKAGFNYVSCSPFKVPIALLASNKLNFEE
jgi:pyruvate,orthophosphate dikinase